MRPIIGYRCPSCGWTYDGTKPLPCPNCGQLCYQHNKGWGDWLAKIIHFFDRGWIKRRAQAKGRDCGCGGRQAMLNRHLPGGG